MFIWNLGNFPLKIRKVEIYTNFLIWEWIFLMKIIWREGKDKSDHICPSLGVECMRNIKDIVIVAIKVLSNISKIYFKQNIASQNTYYDDMCKWVNKVLIT